MDLRRPPQRFWAGFLPSERAYLARGDKFGHRTNRFFDGNVRIDAMLIIKIDCFDPETPKARVTSAADVCRRAIRSPDSVGPHTETELGRYNNAFARNLPQKTAKQFFVLVRAIDFGSIKEVAAEFEIAVKYSKRFLFVGWSVGEGHAHAAE